MKKFFLISLMTMLCTVMAFATVRTAGTYQELQDALTAAVDGDEIQLTDDIAYPTDGTGLIDITKSITLNGKDDNGVIHTISGYGARGSNKTTIAINNSASKFVSVVFKNLTIRNNGASGRPIETRGKITSLTLDNVSVLATGSGNPQGLTIGGNQATTAEISIINSQIINQNGSGYPVISFNPYHLVANNSTIKGYCSLYFKGVDSSAGSRGSVIDATDCNFDSPNIHYGRTNGFGTFVFEDGGITLNLHNCGINAEQLGNAGQYMLVMSSWANLSRRNGSESNIEVNISGDNTYINGEWASNGWSHYNEWQGYQIDNANYASYVEHIVHETGNYQDYKSPYTSYPADQKIGEPWAYTADINLNISGGTYAINPSTYAYNMHVTDYRDEIIGEETVQVIEFSKKNAHIVDGYEVKEIETQQGDQTTTLYRVRKVITTSYNINQDVEGQGDGLNKNTEFVISGSETDQSLTVDSVVANYVEVSDNATLTIPQGKTLEVTNGLDVTEGAQVVVEAGSTLKVGEGGVVAQTTESIVIEANENGAASFLLDPEVIVNTTPNLTVRMTAKQIGRNSAGDFYWHRFALPVAAPATWEKEGNLLPADPGYTVKYPTYVYAWDYVNNAWDNIAPTAMVPLQGYTLTLASDYIHVDGDGKVESEDSEGGNLNVLQDVTYIFKGNLVGNTDQALTFHAEGFNFFGNSFTGYMDVKSMLQGLESNNVDGTVYMWCNDPANTEQYQTYVGTSLHKIMKGKGLQDWQKEVAPMQTFILRLRGADSANESVNYAASIWGNPRYGNNSGASLAPRRRIAEINEELYLEISVKAANGKGDVMDFTEANANTDAFESGFDVEKYMNQNSINLYATVDGMNLSSVVTNNIAGKTLSLKTNGEIAYTMSFKNVDDNEYAIRDNATNQVIAIEEGAIYEFAAQPNSVIEGRFEIIDRAKMPTAIENTEVKANVKGIYTIMGQYLGEDFDILPAGVYVVDGVKIVK